MKTRDEIYQALCTDFQERSGQPLADSSEIAVRLWATAAALESLYYYADWSRQQCFPQTASGQYLDYHGSMRDLTRVGAVCASGKITFYLSAAKDTDTLIPAKTVAATEDQLLFETVCDGTIAAGSTSVQIDAVCQTAGSAGNVAGGMITVLTDAPAGVSKCSNFLSFQGGTDGEDDESYRQRILQTYQRLSTGANGEYYYNQTMATDGVLKCKVIPRGNGIGTVKVLIVGTSDSETLRSTVEKKLNADREISTDVTVEFAEKVSCTVNMYLWRNSGYTFAQAAELARAAAVSYVQSAQIGQSIYLTQIGAQVINSGAVENYAFTEDSQDLTVGEGQYPSLVLNIMEGT